MLSSLDTYPTAVLNILVLYAMCVREEERASTKATASQKIPRSLSPGSMRRFFISPWPLADCRHTCRHPIPVVPTTISHRAAPPYLRIFTHRWEKGGKTTGNRSLCRSPCGWGEYPSSRQLSTSSGDTDRALGCDGGRRTSARSAGRSVEATISLHD